MGRSFALKSLATIAGSCALFAGLAGFTLTDIDEVNAADAVAALRGVVPESLSDLAPTSSDADVAVAASVPGGSITVPLDPSDGISVGDSVIIGLPFAEEASDAADSPIPGVVAFDNNNGSTTVPVVRSDGSTQINTVIENADAPHRYDYPIHIQAGGSLTVDEQGTIAAVDADGAPLTVFGDAWAKDADGAPVATHYEVHGNTLTQVVDFTETTAFPVVADPATTGVYSYNCVLQNGSSYFMKRGERLSNCKGSRLQKYINGRMVQTIALTGYGKPGNPAAFGTLDCAVAILGGAASIYGIGGAVVLTVKGAVAWVGLGTSVYGLKSCAG